MTTSAEIDLFAVAAGNGAALEAAFEEAKASAPGESVLERFAQRIQHDGRIAVNMRQTVLNSFLTFGQHQNTYEWAEWRAEWSSRSAVEIVREKLGPFYERRVTFDGLFVHGRRFRYGALNIAGLGTVTYGEYCVVLREEVSADRAEVAYLKEDSLKTYMLPDLAVDEASLSRDAAPHSHRQCLAALKHADEVEALPEEDWPSLLCSANRYIEAVFTGDVNTGDVELVRISRQDYDVRFLHVFEEFRGGLDEAERMLAEDFAMIWQHLDDKQITLEVIP